MGRGGTGGVRQTDGDTHTHVQQEGRGEERQGGGDKRQTGVVKSLVDCHAELKCSR